jgi:hypothetical protein
MFPRCAPPIAAGRVGSSSWLSATSFARTRASLTLRHQLRDLRNSGQEYEFSTRYFDGSAKKRLTEAHVRFRDLGLTKFPKGHKSENVVEGYPDAIRYRAVGGKQLSERPG